MGCVLNVYKRNANGQKWFLRCVGFLVVDSKIYSIPVILGSRLSPQKYKVLTAFTFNINFNVHSLCGGYINKIFLCSQQIYTEHLYMDLYWSVINTSSLFKYVICNLAQIYGPEEGHLYLGFLTSKLAIHNGSVQDLSPSSLPTALTGQSLQLLYTTDPLPPPKQFSIYLKLSHPEDGGSTFIQNVRTDYIMQ